MTLVRNSSPQSASNYTATLLDYRLEYLSHSI